MDAMPHNSVSSGNQYCGSNRFKLQETSALEIEFWMYPYTIWTKNQGNVMSSEKMYTYVGRDFEGHICHEVQRECRVIVCRWQFEILAGKEMNKKTSHGK